MLRTFMCTLRKNNYKVFFKGIRVQLGPATKISRGMWHKTDLDNLTNFQFFVISSNDEYFSNESLFFQNLIKMKADFAHLTQSTLTDKAKMSSLLTLFMASFLRDVGVDVH